MEKNPDKDLDDGILRHSCSLYSRPLTDEQLNAIGDSLKLNVFVQACCDNYDRIGNINLALVPKGAESYTTSEVQRLEIGRFITPFMDMNKEPNTVPYNYDINYLSPILRDSALRADYDLWLEFELFGVPYAANQQIAGCDGRSDVFKGTLEFETSTPPAGKTKGNLLIPIVMKTPEHLGFNLNNYKEEATDTIGKTVKSYYFDVPQDVTGGQIVLITSNHGANSGGEEYNRRWHYVYVDNELVLSYIPGRESCEPFRQYNTQANGIYGWKAMSDAEWQSFSNWCPGDVIDNRIIYMGDVKKGEHKITISVPDAKFRNQQGDIPVSIYFHAATNGIDEAGIQVSLATPSSVKVRVADGELMVWSESSIKAVEMYSSAGEKICRTISNAPIALGGIAHGIYLVNVYLENGIVETHKVVIGK
ncbi:MAG: hypothetical protein HDR88_01055 [Bacteroides sp.]|nr:hypothetical protein [Bacteroides sp.]